MCFVSSQTVYGQPLPALPLLFAAHAATTTLPARDFLSLLLLRRARGTLRVDNTHDRLSGAPGRGASIADLPTELVHEVRRELIRGVSAAAQYNWEASFKEVHERNDHSNLHLDPAFLKEEEAAAASIGWWNGCMWCDKLRTDALWELAMGEWSGLLQNLRQYLESRGLVLASDRPLDYLSPPSSSEGVFVVCLPTPNPPVSLLSNCYVQNPPALDFSAPTHTSAISMEHSTVVFTREQILAADLTSCSVDDDESAVGFVEESATEQRTVSCSEKRRFATLFKECAVGEEGHALRGARWLRVLEVDCECL